MPHNVKYRCRLLADARNKVNETEQNLMNHNERVCDAMSSQQLRYFSKFRVGRRSCS